MLTHNEIGIIADDLTGACDVAASFSSRMGELKVAINIGDRLLMQTEPMVLNTQSRLLPAGESKNLLRNVGKQLTGKKVIFKKVDSALRGPAGAELEGFLEGLGERRVIIAPAIPKIGKTTRKGKLYEGEVPLTESAYAADPVSPIRSADIAEILSGTGQINCSIPDIETDEDLSYLVEESLKSQEPILFVGSLGLADALAKQVQPGNSSGEGVQGADHIGIVSGSLYQRAEQQIKFVLDHSSARVCDFDEKCNCSGNVLPIILPLGNKLNECKSEGLAAFQELIKKTAGWVRSANINGLGIIGGETSYRLLGLLGVTTLQVYGRMAEVIAYGTMLDGELAGCPFAMKGGSVGPDNSLILMFNYLETGRATI